MAELEVATRLGAIAAEISVCEACALAKGRELTVPGEGPPDARVMVIGEAPGFHENRQGRPFVGQSGQFLTELLASAGLEREDVFIANVVKCRPPGNRDPLPEEIATCSRYLDAQIAAICPVVIVTLGRFSMARYFPGETISRVHGVARRLGDVTYFAMYHPAAALHNPQLKPVILQDMAKLRPVLDQIELAERRAAAIAGKPPSADDLEQLDLF